MSTSEEPKPTIPERLQALEIKLLTTNDKAKALQDPTYLCEPATEEAITAMRDLTGDLTKFNGGRSPRDLPQDYLDFLQHSNGFYLHERGTETSDVNFSAIFHRAQNVEREDYSVDLWLFRANPVLHPLPDELARKFKWPHCRVVDIGPAGDEGNLWMFGPEERGRVIEEIDRVYPELTQAEREVVDGLKVELYGSDEAMREHRFTILEFYHWAPRLRLHLGFTEFVKYLIDKEPASEVVF